MSKIKVKLLNENCEPARTHRWDAGWDLKTTEEVVVPAGGSKKVHTGVIIEIPPRHCGMVVSRSSFGTKHRVTLANDVGIIDSEYRGEIMVFLVNDSDKDLTIKQYERFAQLIIVAIDSSELWIVDKLSETGRGSGGFGSTTKTKVTKEMTEEEEDLIPEVDLSSQAKDIADEIDEKALLTNLSQSEYMKLKNTGNLEKAYPYATGNMKEDLCL